MGRQALARNVAPQARRARISTRTLVEAGATAWVRAAFRLVLALRHRVACELCQVEGAHAHPVLAQSQLAVPIALVVLCTASLREARATGAVRRVALPQAANRAIIIPVALPEGRARRLDLLLRTQRPRSDAAQARCVPAALRRLLARSHIHRVASGVPTAAGHVHALKQGVTAFARALLKAPTHPRVAVRSLVVPPTIRRARALRPVKEPAVVHVPDALVTRPTDNPAA